MTKEYQRRTYIGLQPLEVQKIRVHLLSTAGKSQVDIDYHFKLWVMILLAINLFLRFDEVCNVKIGDFDEQTFSILESGIQNPSIYVKGKSDKKKYLFAL